MVTCWWVVLFAAALWDIVSLQPDRTKPECCPCPKDALGNPLAGQSLGESLDQAAAGSSAHGDMARAAAPGECPCRLRDADSVGAPSVFFPAAVRAVRPFVNLEDSKENPDPILHPEVNLASSVLETLRQVTDEEYEEALARDAARSAVDGEAAESGRNLVTVIVNAKDAMTDDDVMAEASHAHEARCIHPLGRSSMRTSAYKPVLLTDILNLPKRAPPSFRSWNLFDLDSGVGASNVNERVVEPDFKNDGTEIKSAFSTPDLSKNGKPLSTLEKLNLKLPTINLNRERSSSSNQLVLPKLKTSSKISVPSLKDLLPKLSSPNLLRKNNYDYKSAALENQNTPSIFKERYTGFRTNDRRDDDTIIATPRGTVSSKALNKDKTSSFKNVKPQSTKITQQQRNKDEDFSTTLDNENAPSNLREQTTDFLNKDDKKDNAIKTSLKNLLPKLKTPYLLRSKEDDNPSTSSEKKNAASILKAQNAGFARDDCTNDDIIGPTTIRSRVSAKPEILSTLNSIPESKTPNVLWQNENEELSSVSDSQNAASVLEENYSGFAKDVSNNDALVTRETATRPSFKSVETIKFGSKFDPSNLVTTPKPRDASTDLLSNLLKGLEVPNLSNLFSSDIFNLRKNEQAKSTAKESVHTKPDKKPFVTEILDAVPSPSEIKSDHINFDEVEQDGGINNNINEENNEEEDNQTSLKTEIIDHIPETTNFSETENAQTNIITDPNVQAKTNIITKNENAELNDEMEEINDDEIIDDTIISESDRDSQSENINLPTDETDASVNFVGSETTRFDISDANNDQEDEFVNKEKVDEKSSFPFRERIKSTLENLKQRSKINRNLIKLNDIEKPKSSIDNGVAENQSTSDNQNEESRHLKTQIVESVPLEENQDQVGIEDLQEMSDSLLEKEKLQENLQSEDHSLEQNVNADLKDDFETDNVRENENREILNDNRQTSSIDNTMLETNNLNNVNGNENNNKNALECLEKVPVSKTVKQDNTDTNVKNNEMASEASERFTDTIYLDDRARSPLRQSIVLQPTSLSDLNLFNLPKLEMSDPLHLFNPSLKLTDIFKGKETTDEIISARDKDVDNLGTKQSMSPSTSSFRSVLPPLKPLEDINLDILQLKPLGSDLPSIPRLNLNSYKTKLAIPETLQLRPLVIESSVGNKKGLIGASLSFGDNDGNELRPSNMLGQASLKKPNVLGQSLGALPSLDDLRNTMLENAQNLFNTPLETTGRNVVEDTLRSGQVLTENLRVEAENTVKDLHRNLQSTLGLSNHGLLSSSSFRSPNDLFEEISRKHDDVNDKLKGISYDLSDRLETLRNNILDEYRFPAFRSSIFDRMSMLGSPMPRQSSFVKPKAKSSNISNKGKKLSLSSDSRTKGKFVSRSSASKNKLKMPAAASVTSLKAINSPNLRAAESPIFKGLSKDSKRTHLLPRDRPALSLFKNTDKNTIETGRPLLKKPILPKLGQTKVKISFSTTPSPPRLKNKPIFKDLTAKSSSSKDALKIPKFPKSVSRDKTGLLSSFRDSSGHASEPVSTKVKAPFKERQSIKDWKLTLRPKAATMETDGKKEITVYKTTPKPTTDPPGLSRPKPPTLDKEYTSNVGQKKDYDDMKPKSPLISNGAIDKVTSEPLRSPNRNLSWPKTIDDTFLVKVREALRARLAGIGRNLSGNVNSEGISSKSLISDQAKTSGDVDMARSASNSLDVTEVVPGTMKENTSYTCKMTCTKNS